jgi:YD repeat-containing protein
VQGRPDHRLLYDPNGNLHTEIDALGRTTTQEFDALNRLRRLTRPPPDSSEPAPVIQLDLDGRDEVTRVIDPRSLATS